ncbi:hypothetical protein Back2_29110 [Nocardioides baekrokdamisoli]|uniref:DUF304 domain-containing protein n=1 Tax=Nocardioides baekrokdamisoli TaxID=1804624 RepID=A0A3G9J5L7_9ACTN|nr:hypothetical protein [Nocardioides baekrokdamisoli]BBH18624.1 hypothetical protein Back2_29110 [Nocardioides baekrokdamisoli]
MFNEPPKAIFSDEKVWRPSVGSRAALTLTGIVLLGATITLAITGPMTTKSWLIFTLGDCAWIVGIPVVLFRWRLVLSATELSMVFLRTRRIPVRDIVEVKCVARQGLVFVTRNGHEESFGAFGNSIWSQKRSTPSKADLVAREVLRAAAVARGEEPDLDYRLPPITGLKRAAIEGGIWAAIVGIFLGS